MEGLIYLLIATEGEYSDKTTWIVEVFTDEAAAIEEAARLNMEFRANGVMWENYHAKREKLQGRMADVALAEEGRSVGGSDTNRFYHLSREKRNEIDARIDIETAGCKPTSELEADDHTVVAVPIGERGRWELP